MFFLSGPVLLVRTCAGPIATIRTCFGLVLQNKYGTVDYLVSGFSKLHQPLTPLAGIFLSGT
jgi:hypothetical protein